MITLSVSGNETAVQRREKLYAGQDMQLRFSFDKWWQNADKTAFFRAEAGRGVFSNAELSQALWQDEATVNVPKGLLIQQGAAVYVGLYGVDEDGKARATMWARLGIVQPSVLSGLRGENTAAFTWQSPDELQSAMPQTEYIQKLRDMITAELSGSFVVKQAGKGLSSNDYTDEDKAALWKGLSQTEELSRTVVEKITAPDKPESGKVLKVARVNEDGTAVYEWSMAAAEGVDIRINGQSIAADGIADIPLAKSGTVGLVGGQKLEHGIGFDNDGLAFVAGADQQKISGRDNYCPIVPSMLDFAVKAAMCDGMGAAWTESEQQAALQRLGILPVSEVMF